MTDTLTLASIPAVYGAGVVTSFTPCVYPLIPIVAGAIGALTDKKLKGFFLSLVYVAGLSFTYALLGVGASLAGRIFGLTSQNPWVNISVALVLIVFGLAMLDIINISFIGIKSSSSSRRPGGWGGILLLGAASGLVAAPCSTPVLGSILAMVTANTPSVLFSGTLLFVYGFGLGTLLIAVGTFSGLAASLPKSGRWMDIVKKIFGTVIIIAGFYYLVFKGFLLF